MKPIKHKGDSVKAIGNNRIGGYLVRFTHADDPDLHGEYFNKDTDFWIERGYPVKGAPILIEHGFDDAFKVMPVGVLDFVDEKEAGLWVEGKLHERAEYEEMLRKMRKSKKLNWDDSRIGKQAELIEKTVKAYFATDKVQWSSGALPQSVEVEDNHIKSWAIIEGTGTVQPAESDGTEISLLKSAFRDLNEFLNQLTDSPTGVKGGTDHKDDNGVGADNEPPQANVDTNDNSDTKNKDKSTMDENQIRDIVRMALEEYDNAKMDDNETIDEEEAIASVSADVAKMDDEEADEEEMAKAVAGKAWDFIEAKLNARDKARKAAQGVGKARLDAMKAQPATSKLPAFTGNGNGLTPQAPKIEVGDDRRFVGKSAKDLALTVKMMYSQIPEYQREHMKLGEVVRDESFLNHLKAKIGYALEANPLGADDAIAMKSAAPFIRKNMKAEELMATDIAAQGQEWVSIFYVAESWREAEEDNQLYNLLSSRGMQVKSVPRGVNQVEFKTTDRGAEMYTRGEPNSLDATGRPESTVNYSTPVTGKITKTLKEHAIAVAYSHRLDLQSLLDVAQEVNWDIDQALGEGLEFVLLNGDTQTGASTNINLIDGTPATGLATPKYIAFDGLRKEPLVTVAAQSRSAGGALTSADYLNTHKLFPNKIQARIQNHLFVIDSQTKNKTRTLTDIKTKDVAGDENTLFTGRIPDLFDIPVYTSSQLALANTSGMVSATAGNNLYGSILDIYAPYCAYGRQQDIMVETARDIDSGATKFVANIYHVFMTRAANSVMMTYYVGA